MRQAEVTRNTLETRITLKVNLDGTGKTSLDYRRAISGPYAGPGGPSWNDRLEVISQGGFAYRCSSYGGGYRYHRRTGIRSGSGDKSGLRRYGHSYVPLDEALSRVVVDLSGRPGMEFNVEFMRARIGEFDVDLISEFFQGFVNHAMVTLHIDNLSGRNAHHQAETVFKAFGRALRMAVEARSTRSGHDTFHQRHSVTSLHIHSRGMTDIAIVDYGMGNLRSVVQSLEHVAPDAS